MCKAGVYGGGCGCVRLVCMVEMVPYKCFFSLDDAETRQVRSN